MVPIGRGPIYFAVVPVSYLGLSNNQLIAITLNSVVGDASLNTNNGLKYDLSSNVFFDVGIKYVLRTDIMYRLDIEK
jgi:hypothetical protein